MVKPLTLPKALRRDGFDLTQVYRDGCWAIYRQTKVGQSWERFEVIRIRVRGAHAFLGTEYPAAESYPSSEDWGSYGWTCHDLEAAHKRLEMEQNENNAHNLERNEP